MPNSAKRHLVPPSLQVNHSWKSMIDQKTPSWTWLSFLVHKPEGQFPVIQESRVTARFTRGPCIFGGVSANRCLSGWRLIGGKLG